MSVAIDPTFGSPIMHSRWFNAAVVMLWLATMSWLVTEKVLPPLLVGEPPSYSRIVEAQKDAPPVGWRMSLNGRPLGWALSDTKLQPTGLTEIHGRVHFDALPLEEMMPGWLRALSRLIEQPIDRLQMDARSVLTIDSLGHLVRFDSTVRVDPFNEVIRVHGTVEGRQLQLVVRAGGASFTSEAFLPVRRVVVRRLVAADPTAGPSRRPDLDRARLQPPSGPPRPRWRSFTPRSRAWSRSSGTARWRTAGWWCTATIREAAPATARTRAASSGSAATARC